MREAQIGAYPDRNKIGSTQNINNELGLHLKIRSIHIAWHATRSSAVASSVSGTLTFCLSQAMTGFGSSSHSPEKSIGPRRSPAIYLAWRSYERRLGRLVNGTTAKGKRVWAVTVLISTSWYLLGCSSRRFRSYIRTTTLPRSISPLL